MLTSGGITLLTTVLMALRKLKARTAPRASSAVARPWKSAPPLVFWTCRVSGCCCERGHGTYQGPDQGAKKANGRQDGLDLEYHVDLTRVDEGKGQLEEPKNDESDKL